MMNYYELNYVISPKISEEEIENLSQEISGFIQEEDGRLKEAAKPLKQGPGFLAVLNFSLEPEKLGNLEKKLKTKTEILRYLVLRKKIEKEVSRKRVLPEVKKSFPRFEKKAKPKKVELKEIDRKIEEILNTD